MAERRQRVRTLLLFFFLLATPAAAQPLALEKPNGTVRVATFNASLARKGAGVLIADIGKRDPQVLAVAEILRLVRPDIVLINELDYDADGIAVRAFMDLLAAGPDVLDLPHHHAGPVNTGVPSRLDLDRDGRTMGPGDALGFGRFPGQYGMAVLSRFELGPVRTFQNLLWSTVPWAEEPISPDGTPWYTDMAWEMLPLSSKSHWDVTVALPDGRALHVLASHPTPPVFDGPEDRNGLRNAAEIRFWVDYIEGAEWPVDDDGVAGGLADGADFVILGDLNADPLRGDGRRETIAALLGHSLVQDTEPTSPGATAAGRPGDTADWPEQNGPGNMRVDYALPSRSLSVTGSGVFWPAPDDPLAQLVQSKGRDHTSSDHRLVWVDFRVSE